TDAGVHARDLLDRRVARQYVRCPVAESVELKQAASLSYYSSWLVGRRRSARATSRYLAVGSPERHAATPQRARRCARWRLSCRTPPSAWSSRVTAGSPDTTPSSPRCTGTSAMLL